ncbi:MAG: acyl-ACP--UDP-N-acetylglucosamine O-acyltransferase [Gemmataceae bacterium]|nr:acyl-ACP--UDP-N-acetylglucosamine O-acyltransferase [Gemmataceae bacterium]
MSQPTGARIHPTAIISPEAELAADVQIGPYAILEGAVRIGAGCVIRPHCHLVGPLTMGEGNHVYTGAVLGERPQHLRYADEPTRVEIGDHNVFREHVTVHRGTSHSWATRIGNHNYLMAHSHVAHDCQIGNRCIFANGALLAGHATIEDNVFLSGNCAVHQFGRVGRLALLSGCSIAAKDVPTFGMVQGINCITGVNVVGMRRAGLSHEQINAVRKAYRILFYEGTPMPIARAKVQKELGAVDVVVELLTFMDKSVRGICNTRERVREAA